MTLTGNNGAHMVEVRPFRACTYAGSGPEEFGSLVAPPYDVVDYEDEVRLKRNERNIAHVTLIGQNGFEGAALNLKKLIDGGILKEDSAECFYIYEQTFPSSGEIITRTALVCLLRLENLDRGAVLPHEEIFPKPEEERRRLLAAIRANTEPIFCMYDDAAREADAVMERCKATGDAVCSFTDSEGVVHKIYRVSSIYDMDVLQNSFVEKTAIIADGHHRYAAALNYMKERSAGASAPESYVMAAFVNTYDPGLRIYPIHRLVHGVESALVEKLHESLDFDFKIRMFAKGHELLEAMQSPKPHTIGFWNTQGIYFTATARQERLLNSFPASSPREMLDVSMLQKFVLEKHLGLDNEKIASNKLIDYVKGTAKAVEMLKAHGSKYQLGIFLNGVSPREVKLVAESGGRMPQKSTFFYPKFWSGLLVRMLDG